MLLITSMMFCETASDTAASNTTYEFIFIDPDTGNAIIPADKIIPLANYIKRLEELNKLYLEQIKTYETLVENYEKQIKALEEEVNALEDELQKEKSKKIVWQVITAIAVGSIVYLFIKGGF